MVRTRIGHGHAVNVNSANWSVSGLEYDHSFSHHDALPHWLRVGDTWTNIDYKQHPKTWMKPLVRGEVTGLVEIPASWYLDDLPPMVSL